jgi:hypothetical protein
MAGRGEVDSVCFVWVVAVAEEGIDDGKMAVSGRFVQRREASLARVIEMRMEGHRRDLLSLSSLLFGEEAGRPLHARRRRRYGGAAIRPGRKMDFLTL